MNNDLISREQVLHEIGQLSLAWEYGQGVTDCYIIVKNAPTVEPYIPPEVLNKFAKYVAEHARPKGECKSCRHRDPEDKKCDCGAQERQGCPFPVNDDYYCKYYEKGGAE